jgi:rSAM/selenodomain-associated transferase 2
MFPKPVPPRISVIIPALHEADRINRTLDRIRSADHRSQTEIIVVDGDPAETTLRAVVGPDITKISAPAGRSIQMNAGAGVAGGDILLFLHADTLLPETAVKSISDVCRDPEIAGGAFDLAIDAPGPVFRVIEKTASLRSRLTRIPYGDQAIFIKAVCFHELGGFSSIPIMEDIDLMRRIKRRGYRIRFIAGPVKTDARRWEQDGVLYTTLRNWTLSTLFYAGVSPEKLKKYY